MSRGQGFRGMSPEKQKMLASQGGKAAHKKKVAHEFDSKEARAAGKKGGLATSANREHMARIGSLGGKAKGAKKNKKEETDSDEIFYTSGSNDSGDLSEE